MMVSTWMVTTWAGSLVTVAVLLSYLVQVRFERASAPMPSSARTGAPQARRDIHPALAVSIARLVCSMVLTACPQFT